jgi:LacI family kdg operon repressor
MPSKTPLVPARSTIADVARKAGVSKATVSRFLNHRDTLLSADIAAKVEAAIAALDYTPRPMAQALKRGHSRLIGMVVADVTNPYSVAVLRGAEKACQEAGYLVMLFNLGNEPGREREAIALLSSYQVDGFILNTVGQNGGMAEAARHGKPAVLIDRRLRGMAADFVSIDNAGAVQSAVHHLVDSGYHELLYITEPLKNVSSRMEREAAFRAYLSELDAGISGRSIESMENDAATLEAALRDLRERAQAPRRPAVLSGNAVITLRVAAAMARMGWRFGADLGFVGFDEAEWAPLIGPGLSTIAQPTDDLGRQAALCMLQRLKGETPPPRQILLPSRLIVRGSSAPDMRRAGEKSQNF